jgi:hypothetical protein
VGHNGSGGEALTHEAVPSPEISRFSSRTSSKLSQSPFSTPITPLPGSLFHADPHGELLFSLFGALAQYERALTRERVMAGLAAAKRRGRQGGRPPAIAAEKLEAVTAALAGGASKAAVCRNFGIAQSTLIGTLERIGWVGSTKV